MQNGMKRNGVRRVLSPRLLASERGFTLVELMVVVLIIAILLGISIPMFLGLRTRSQDRVAQTAVIGVLKTEIGLFSSDTQVFTDDVATLESVEPALNYDGFGADTCNGFPNPYCVQVDLLSPNEVMMTVMSSSGTYWAIREFRNDVAQGTFFNAGGDGAPPAPGDVVDSSW